MKIKSLDSDNTYVLPFDNSINIIVTNKYKDDLIQCLSNACTAKRKNKVMIYSDDNEKLNSLDCNFIYVPYGEPIDNNFIFKSKSTFNVELDEFIQHNPDKFLSMDTIRNGCHDLLTDKGFYDFERIIDNGLEKHVRISMQDFNVSSILQMLQIELPDYSITEKYIIIYNLLLYINRDKTNIVYIDCPIDESMFVWLKKVASPNDYFFMDNESIMNLDWNFEESLDFIVLSNQDFKEELYFKHEELTRLSYLFHSFVLKNISQQSEKNLALYKFFEDKSSTFCVKFNDTFYSNRL